MSKDASSTEVTMVQPGFPVVPGAGVGMGRALDEDRPDGVDPSETAQRDDDGDPVGSADRDADIYGTRDEDDRQGINDAALDDYLSHRDSSDR